MNANLFIPGKPSPLFVYNGKERSGKVEKVTGDVVTLQVDYKEFKSFRLDKMTPIK